MSATIGLPKPKNDINCISRLLQEINMSTTPPNISMPLNELANGYETKPASIAPSGTEKPRKTVPAKARTRTTGALPNTSKTNKTARVVMATPTDASSGATAYKSKPAVAAKKAIPASVKAGSPLDMPAKSLPPELPKVEKPLKEKKPKLVRDSFTIPKLEYLLLDQLKHRSGALGMAVKKSELIRAGIKALAAMPDADYVAAVKAVPTIKTGRPTKD
jgi:hypothetical protein